MRSAFFFILVIACLAITASALNPLFDYINKADDVYDGSYTYLLPPVPQPAYGVTIHFLRFKSLRWLNADVTDASEWSNTLAVLVPTVLEAPDLAAVFVTGGQNNSDPTKASELAIGAQIAAQTKSLVAILFQAPNQPVTRFYGQTLLTEDALVAKTWEKYQTDFPFVQAETIVQFPMAKATSRALDLIEKWSKEQLPVAVDKFYLLGASKRGLAVALSAAYEGSKLKPRVVGVSSLVYDLFDMKKNLLRMRALYGGWTWPFVDYLQQGAIQHIDSFAFDVLSSVIDPTSLFYWIPFSRIPKLFITASNDQFMVIDNDKSYWKIIPGEAHRLILANAEHSLATALPGVIAGVSGHILSTYYDVPRPRLNWDTDKRTGKLTLSIWKDQPKPSTVVKYQSDSIVAAQGQPIKRDFRKLYANNGSCIAYPANPQLCVNTNEFVAEQVTPVNSLLRWTYSYQDMNPPHGIDDKWTAYYLQASYSRNVQVRDYQGKKKNITINEVYSTSATVWPNTEPEITCDDWDSCPELNNLV